MKFIIEMTAGEMKDAIANGSLHEMLKNLEPTIQCEDEGMCCEHTKSMEVNAPSTLTSVPVVNAATEPLSEPQKGSNVTPVATTTKIYTRDELAIAAMDLVQQGMRTQLQDLLKQFGVASLPDLSQDAYGAFATALRGLGAKI